MKRVDQISKKEEERALDLHRKAIIIDALDSTGPTALNEGYFQKQVSGGVTAIGSAASCEDDFQGAMNVMLDYYRVLESNGDRVVLAVSADDIQKAKRDGKIALVIGLQNAKPTEGNHELLKILHRLGIRNIQLTYQKRNVLGDGCGERTNCGLSEFGLKVVEQMNKLGLLIDLSHVGIATTMDAIEASKDPVAFTHTCVRTICNFVRNKGDEEIKAMAEKGGVMGIGYLSQMVKDRGYVLGTTIEEYLDHIDYAVKLAGINHVGLGLDYKQDRTKEGWGRSAVRYLELAKKEPYDFANATVKELKDIENLQVITRGLVARGYSDQDIEKILGGNFLRLFQRVWR